MNQLKTKFFKLISVGRNLEFYDYDVTKCAVILRSSLAVVLSDPMVNNYNLFAQKGKSSAFTGYLAGNSQGVA